MKRCPHCNADNLEYKSVCSACGKPLPPSEENNVQSTTMTAPEITRPSDVKEEPANFAWMCVIALLFPFYGILYSIALVLRGYYEDAKTVGLLSFFINIVEIVIVYALFFRK